MALGEKLLGRVAEMASEKMITLYNDKETNKSHLLIPYDNDRMLQFAFIENEKPVFEQRFFARWRIDSETSKLIGESELNNII